MLDLREETRANLAVGSETDPAAGSTECLSNRRDDADFAHAVGKGIATCCFTGFTRWQRRERQHPIDALDNLGKGHDNLGGPEAAFFERHELDEAHNHVFFASKARKSFYFCVVE